jgi:hypothetical protein
LAIKYACKGEERAQAKHEKDEEKARAQDVPGSKLGTVAPTALISPDEAIAWR